MGQAADDAAQMEKLRELIAVLLGVGSVSEELAADVSQLFKLFHKLEVQCPNLCCHFHVSGVSRVSGHSFFVVIYDAALMRSDAARRVIKTVYTHLHSEASMEMTAALYRQIWIDSSTATRYCQTWCRRGARGRWTSMQRSGMSGETDSPLSAVRRRPHILLMPPRLTTSAH